MYARFFLARVAVALVIVVSAAQSSFANLQTPFGNPTGAGIAYSTNLPGEFSELIPRPAVYLTAGTDPANWVFEVLEILQAVNYAGTTGPNPTAVWTFVHAAQALQGGIELTHYYAWADTPPAFTVGTMTFAADPNGNYGGAVIGLTYKPSTQQGTTDPQLTLTPYPDDPDDIATMAPGTYYGFIQVLRDTDPTPFETQFGQLGTDGFTYSVDNPFSVDTNGIPTSPFYNVGGAAQNQFFADRPQNPYNGATIEFAVFVATDTVTINNQGVRTHSVTLYDGVNWGFHVSPEPGSFAMCAGAAFAWLAGRSVRWRKKPSAAAQMLAA